MTNTQNTAKRVAMITGAAKRIGAIIATDFVKRGYDIILHYNHSSSKATNLKNELLHINPNAKIFTIGCDLSDQEQISCMTHEILNHFENIDILINNASIFQYDDLNSLNIEHLQYNMQIHLTAPLILSKWFMDIHPHHPRNRSIINIVDARVTRPSPYFLSYTLSKTALWNATQMLAMQLAPNIRINAIALGPSLQGEQQNQEQFNAQCKALPLKNSINESDIIHSVQYLDDNQSITGQLLHVCGGEQLGWQYNEFKAPRFFSNT